MVSQTANTPSEAAISSITDIGRSRGALVGGRRRLGVFDGDDIPGFFPGGRLHPYFGIQGLADQGAGQWGIDADLLGLQIQFVGADNPDFAALDWPAALGKIKVLVPGPDSEIRTQFDMYCAQIGLQLVPFAEVDDMAMLRLLARRRQTNNLCRCRGTW